MTRTAFGERVESTMRAERRAEETVRERVTCDECGAVASREVYQGEAVEQCDGRGDEWCGSREVSRA